MSTINPDNLKREFERIGARLVIIETEAERRARPIQNRRPGDSGNSNAPQFIHWAPTLPFSANVRTDRRGEHFTMRIGDNSQIPEAEVRRRMDPSNIQVLDSQPQDRHLVLQVVLGEGRDRQVDKFLMGHDERHWFMARVSDSVTTVQQAKLDLQPAAVEQEIKRKRVKRSKRTRRRNAAFLRQGEWFFLPTDFVPDDKTIVSRNEPLVRGGGGKPHIAEHACRVGGRTVMVNHKYAPNGISMDEYNKLRNQMRDDPDFRRSGSWNAMTRDAGVYVRGAIRHPDHKTLKLKRWYRVVPNTEQRRDVAGRVTTMAFLD